MFGAGFRCDGARRRCGALVESAMHRFWTCPSNLLLSDRAVQTSQYLQSRAVQGGANWACFWLRGIMPADYEPAGDGTPAENRRALACTVQHNLFDIWQHRQTLAPSALQPQSRWTRAVRPRTEKRGELRSREPQQQQDRNVRPRAIPATGTLRTRAEDIPTQTRSVRAKAATREGEERAMRLEERIQQLEAALRDKEQEISAQKDKTTKVYSKICSGRVNTGINR